MPSTILSDNGVSSGSAGLKTTAASDGALALQTTTSGGTATTAVTIDTSQNVGLGVTPSAWSVLTGLQVKNAGVWGSGADSGFVNNGFFNGSGWRYITTSGAALYQTSSNVHAWYNAASGTAGNAISFTQAMTLNASGSLLLNTTSTPTYGGAGSILLNNATAVDLEFNISNTLTGYIYAQSSNFQIGSATSIPLVFLTGNTERARIDSSGNLLVGKIVTNDTTVGAVMQSTGRIAGSMAASTNAQDTMTVYSTGASAYRFYVGLGGTVYATSTTISAISDIRFKENVRDLDAGLTEIMALKPRLYDWKEGKGANIKNARGFIAQEFEEVFPDLIDEWKDEAPEGEDPYKSVRADLIPVLVKAIQELNAKFEAYKATHP